MTGEGIETLRAEAGLVGVVPTAHGRRYASECGDEVGWRCKMRCARVMDSGEIRAYGSSRSVSLKIGSGGRTLQFLRA